VGKETGIEWTNHTFNPWWGCTKVSPGCANCYAERDSARWGQEWGKGAPRRVFGTDHWKQPLHWNQAANAAGVRRRVFCASMADLFEDEGPVSELAKLLELIGKTPHLDWQLLTKRPQNWSDRVHAAFRVGWEGDEWASQWLDGDAPANVWIGTSVEDQARALERIPHLLRIPARVRFLSCEPLLGPLRLDHLDVDAAGDPDWCQINALSGHHTDMCRPCPDVPRIHWVIAGGESGKGARPVEPWWFQSLRDQCAHAGAAFFFKQWGEFHPNLDGDLMVRVGKKIAGRILDGVTHDGMPA